MTVGVEVRCILEDLDWRGRFLNLYLIVITFVPPVLMISLAWRVARISPSIVNSLVVMCNSLFDGGLGHDWIYDGNLIAKTLLCCLSWQLCFLSFGCSVDMFFERMGVFLSYLCRLELYFLGGQGTVTIIFIIVLLNRLILYCNWVLLCVVLKSLFSGLTF